MDDTSEGLDIDAITEQLKREYAPVGQPLSDTMKALLLKLGSDPNDPR